MKPHTEMIEGPKALQNFEDTMKKLFSAQKPDTSNDKQKPSKSTKRQRKAKG
jgi:hypothetical protein